MTARSLARIREYLRKTAQTQAVILPQVTLATGKKKKKKQLTPEAVKTIKELQRLPRDVFSGARGVGSAIQSAALGGAIGTGLAFPVAGLTAGGFKAGPAVRKAGTGQVGRLEKFFGGGRETELARRAIRSGAVRNLALAGAGTGLATNVYYQAKRKKLEKQLQQQLDKGSKKKKKKAPIVKTAQLSGDEKMPEEKFNEMLNSAETEWTEAMIKEARGVTAIEREAAPVPEPTEIEETIRREVGPEKLAHDMRKKGAIPASIAKSPETSPQEKAKILAVQQQMKAQKKVGSVVELGIASMLGKAAAVLTEEQGDVGKEGGLKEWAKKKFNYQKLPPHIAKLPPKDQAAWYKKHHMDKKAEYEIGGIKVAKDMPPFVKQDRPEAVKDIYKALKREHPEMPAEMKARIAARQGKPGKQEQGPPYKGPIKEGALRPDHWADRSAVRAFNHYAEFMNDAIRAKEKGNKDEYGGITAAQRDDITRQYNKLTGKKVPMTKDYKGLQSFIIMAKKEHENDEMRCSPYRPLAKKEERLHHMMTIKTGADDESLKLAVDLGLVKEAQGEGLLTATLGEKGEAVGAAAGLIAGAALGAAVKGSGDRVVSSVLGGLLGTIVGAAGGRMGGGTAEVLMRGTQPGPYAKKKRASYEIGGMKVAAGEAAAVEELGLTSAAGESVQADQEGVKKDFVDKKDTATTKDLQQVVHPPQTTDALFKEKDGFLQDIRKIAQGQGYHPQMAAGGRRGPQVVYVMVPYKKPSAGKRTKEFVKKHRAALPILGTLAGAGGGAALGEYLNIPGGALSGAGLGGLTGALSGHYAEKRLAKTSEYEINGEKIARERKPGDVSKKDVKQIYEKSVRTSRAPMRRGFIWDVGDVVGRQKGREEYKPSTMIAIPMRKAAQQRPANPMMGGGDVRYTVGPSPEDVAEYLRTQEQSRQVGALAGAGLGAAGGGALGYYGGGALAQGLGLGQGGEAASRIAGTLLGGGLGGVVGGRVGAPTGEAIGGLVAEQTTPAAQIETPFLSPERSEAIARRLAVAPMLRGGRTPTVAIGPG